MDSPLFYRVVGNYSVLTTVPELASQLGHNLEPSPSHQPIGVFGEGHSALPGLPVGALFCWYPNDINVLSELLGLDLKPSSLPEVSGALSGYVVDPAEFAVPQSITATQIRLWMFRNGISLESVQAAIDAMPDENARGETRIQWEYAPYIERSHPFVDALGLSLGLTSEQIDRAFSEAARL
jgi:hypothetical protein